MQADLSALAYGVSLRYCNINEFGTALASMLDVDVVEINAYDSLYDDWAIDSLQAFQLIVLTESMAEAMVPPPELPELYTVADAYAYYCALVEVRNE